jgi:gliding motility-associated-like protein
MEPILSHGTEVNVACSDSASITVNFYQQPVANPGTGGNFCGLEAVLNAVVDLGTGTWSMAEGPGIVTFIPDAGDPAATATASEYGNYNLLWTEVNGTCSDTASIIVRFIDSPLANAGPGGDECDLDFGLNAISTSGNGSWSKFTGPGDVVFTPGIDDPKALVTVKNYGTYEFQWTVENTACTSTDQTTVTFHELPSVYAGQDTAICKGSTIQLQGQGEGVFYWSPDSAVSDSSIARPMTTPDSTTIYILSLTDQFGCINTDSVQVLVRDTSLADAGPDQVLEYTFNTYLDASLNSEYDKGVWSLLKGTGEIVDTINPKTLYSGFSTGDNNLLWTVSNDVCPANLDSVTITVNDLKNPTLITPNQDGRNDYFVIQGLETLGKTELNVFDRRGAIVYKNTDYNNDWNGVDYSGNSLPDGTYFYVFNSANGRSLSGFIVLRR